MAMYASRQPRLREVRGPQPNSVAIIARPRSRRPPEHLILDHRAQEDMRGQAEDMSKYIKQCDLKSDWVRQTDRKIQLNTVKRRVESTLKAHELAMEDKRDRLRAMLQQEEQRYLAEMANKEETVIERQAKLRQRAKDLKEKREQERLAFVQEKLEQQFRDQCEELRSTLSKRQQDQVAAERMTQVEMKAQLEKKRQEEEEMYAKLWQEDMQIRARREEADALRQMSANHDVLAVLQKQIAALEAKKKEEKEKVWEEAALLRKQAELRKIEERMEAEEKRRRQQEVRNMYNQSVELKNQKRARDEQEELAFDMKILEQVLEESRNEARELTLRKQELREEDRRYRDYLRQLKEMETQREYELERLCDLEVEKAWEKRLDQWRLEKQARQKLLQDVMKSRKKQIEQKLKLNEEQRAEAQLEREELMHKIIENRAVEREQIQRLRDQNHHHQQDLLAQIQYNRSLRELEQAEQEREWAAGKEAEMEYRAKLEDALRNPTLTKLHPMRRAQVTSSVQRPGLASLNM